MTRITRSREVIITCPVHTIATIGATSSRKVRGGFNKSEWPLDLLNAFTTIVDMRREQRVVNQATLAKQMDLTVGQAEFWLRRLLARGAIRGEVGRLRLTAGSTYFVAPRFAAFGEAMTKK